VSILITQLASNARLSITETSRAKEVLFLGTLAFNTINLIPCLILILGCQQCFLSSPLKRLTLSQTPEFYFGLSGRHDSFVHTVIVTGYSLQAWLTSTRHSFAETAVFGRSSDQLSVRRSIRRHRQVRHVSVHSASTSNFRLMCLAFLCYLTRQVPCILRQGNHGQTSHVSAQIWAWKNNQKPIYKFGASYA
jgi:hypothetical protein